MTARSPILEKQHVNYFSFMIRKQNLFDRIRIFIYPVVRRKLRRFFTDNSIFLCRLRRLTLRHKADAVKPYSCQYNSSSVTLIFHTFSLFSVIVR